MSIGFALFAQAVVAVAAFEAPPVPDPVLADLRGGIQLPNGIDLALTVQTQTAVNGAVVLQTVFSLTDGPPKVVVYAPSDGRTVAAPAVASSGASAGTTVMPTVTYDNRGGLVQVTPGLTVMPVAIGTGEKAAQGAVANGLEQVASGATTDNGTISQALDGSVRAIKLTGSDFSVTHLAGGTFGSAIANSGSDRTISTVTSVSIDLRNAGPDVLGSAMLRVEDTALSALASRL